MTKIPLSPARIACRMLLVCCAFLFLCFPLAQRAAAQGNSPAATPQPSPSPTPAKHKRVWTNDDLDSHNDSHSGPAGSGENAAQPGAKSGEKERAKAPPGATGDAARYRAQLVKLNAQLADVDRKLAAYRTAGEGESAPSQGVPVYRIRRADISTQIDALQKRHDDLTKQIEDVEDQARHDGIEPGQLR